MTQILQPLSGEYAASRKILEQIPFPIGYGIETSMILDIWQRWGLDVMCQVDLEKRVHRNQDTKALGKMAFVILQTFLRRLSHLDRLTLKGEMFNQMIQYRLVADEYEADLFTYSGHERPPMINIAAYREKFCRDAPPAAPSEVSP